MKGIVKVGKVHIDSFPALKQIVKDTPSYYLVKGSMKDYVQYKNKISGVGISKFVLGEIEKTLKQRNAGKAGGKS